MSDDAQSGGVTVWRLVCGDGTTRDVRVWQHPSGRFVASLGGAGTGAGVDAHGRTPREAVGVVSAKEGGGVRQVLAPGELSVAEAWQAAAEATRAAFAHQIDALAGALDAGAVRYSAVGLDAEMRAAAEVYRELAVLARGMSLPERPS